MPTIKSMNEYKAKTYPKLLYTTKVLKQLLCMLSTKHAENKEFMFLGTIEKANDTYLIKDIFLVPQTNCSAAYCETDDNKYPEWLNENFKNIEERKTIRLHGHSHVNMGTSPSGTDDQQIMHLCDSVNNYFIQLIVNHRLENTCNIWDKEQGLIFNNVDQYIIINEELIEFNGKKNMKHISKNIQNGTYNVENNIVALQNYSYNLVTGEKIFTDNNITIVIGPQCDVKLTNPKDKMLKEMQETSEKLIKERNLSSYINPSKYYDNLFDFDSIYDSMYNNDTITVKPLKGKEKTLPIKEIYNINSKINLEDVIDGTVKVIKISFNGQTYQYKEIEDDNPLKNCFDSDIILVKNKETNEEKIMGDEEYYEIYYDDKKYEYIGNWCSLVNQFIRDWDETEWI